VRWITILVGLAVGSSVATTSWALEASPAPVAASPAPAAAAPTAQGDPAVRLHDLERRVDELKEQVFRSKARLNLLKETVLHGVIAGAHAVILYRNEIGSMYTPVQYAYSLDGSEIYAKVDESGKLADQKEFEIFNGSLAPGNHTMSVRMVYVGNGYGVFSYLKGYRFNVNSSRTFTAAEGKQFQLKVVGHEKGNMLTTDMKDRLDVAYREMVLNENEGKETPVQAKK
jgi:hypothetical protein